MCPGLESKNQAERCIEVALSSPRELISPPWLALPSITYSPLPVTLPTADKMLRAIMTKRRREKRGNGGKMKKGEDESRHVQNNSNRCSGGVTSFMVELLFRSDFIMKKKKHMLWLTLTQFAPISTNPVTKNMV